MLVSAYSIIEWFIFNNIFTSAPRWIWDDRYKARSADMAIYHLISNKREFGIIVLLKATMQKILLDLADFALQDQQQFNGLYYFSGMV